jgi:hypothetical protein
MTDPKAAWSETGEQLTALAAKLSAHYEQKHGMDKDKAREETQAALKRLGIAVQDAFEAVGAAARDEAVRHDVKSVGTSLLGAFEATFRQVSGEIRKRTSGSSSDTPPASPSGWASATPSGSASDTPSGSASDTPSGSASDTPSGSASDTPSGSSSDAPYGSPSDSPADPASERPPEQDPGAKE